MTDGSTALEPLVEQAGSLYSLPAVAVRVLELTNDPHIDVRALKQCIENDPALTTKILRVVNSPLFGLSKEVSDLNQALALLGVKPLKLLVLGFSLPDALFAELSGDLLKRYWQQTLIKAVAAREISETMWDTPGDEAFIAGLLQDLGMLVLLQTVGEPYARFLRTTLAERQDLLTLERTALGFNHTELSARLLARWGLPDAIVESLSVQHASIDEPVEPARPRLSQVVHLAGLVSTLLTEEQPEALADLQRYGRRYRAIDESRWDELIGTLQERVEQLDDVLSLELPAGIDFGDVLTFAHQQLIDVAADVAGDLARQRSDTIDAGAEQELAAYRELQSLSTAVQRVTQAAPSAAEPTQAKSVATATAPRKETAAVGSVAPQQVDDPALLGWLTSAVAACRQSRWSLSLLLVEVDRFDAMLLRFGPVDAETLVLAVANACRELDHSHVHCVQIGETRFAVILLDCDRQQAVWLGGQLRREVRELSAGSARDATPAVTVSIGAATVALPPKNFPPQDLVEAADRCLYGARASGGDSVKSIEIY